MILPIIRHRMTERDVTNVKRVLAIAMILGLIRPVVWAAEPSVRTSATVPNPPAGSDAGDHRNEARTDDGLRLLITLASNAPTVFLPGQAIPMEVELLNVSKARAYPVVKPGQSVSLLGKGAFANGVDGVPLAAASDDVHAGPIPQRITNDEFFQRGDHGDIYFADVQADRSVRDKAADRLSEAGPAAGSATLPHADAFRIQCRKPADHVAVTVGADTTTFTVTSPSGIGSASIERTGPAWPASVILRLDLKGLEGIVISNGQTRLSGSADRNGETRLEADGTGEIAKGNPLWMEIERDQGCLKMAIPQAMLKTAKTLMIEWVDFFR